MNHKTPRPTRECLVLAADTLLLGLRVARELDDDRLPRSSSNDVFDNGTELTGTTSLRWAENRQVDWHYIAPGKPQALMSAAALPARDGRLHYPGGSAPRPPLLHRVNWAQIPAHRWIKEGTQVGFRVLSE